MNDFSPLTPANPDDYSDAMSEHMVMIIGPVRQNVTGIGAWSWTCSECGAHESAVTFGSDDMPTGARHAINVHGFDGETETYVMGKKLG
jgi:hypothetical protein